MSNIDSIWRSWFLQKCSLHHVSIYLGLVDDSGGRVQWVQVVADVDPDVTVEIEDCVSSIVSVHQLRHFLDRWATADVGEWETLV